MPDLVTSSDTLSLDRPPEAQALSIETLVGHVMKGRVRIPGFQRGLKWNALDVVELLGSVRNGLPIGSLLMWRRKAESESVTLGPLKIEARGRDDAWYVVDGQQRLVALAVSLCRPLPIPRHPVDPYVVYFDPHEERFCAPPADGAVPDEWVGLPNLLDATRLSEFVFEWPFGKDVALRKRLFDAGKRLREYNVPLYVVETDNEKVLRQIFFRVNKTGHALAWSEVHDALYGSYSGSPSTISELADSLQEVGMGRLSDGELNQCLLALRGLDVTRTLAQHFRRDPNCLDGAVADALSALRRTLVFLSGDARIPHLRLLPVSSILEPLVRFFSLHANPQARSLELLVRWVWRTIFTEETHNDRTFRRKSVRCINAEDEEGSLQALLGLVPREAGLPVPMDGPFDARSARSRTAMLLMTLQGPCDVALSHPLDVARLLNEHEAAAFPKVFASVGGLGRAPVNRLVHPPLPHMRQRLVRYIELQGVDDPVLASHGIGTIAAKALLAGDAERFFAVRNATLVSAYSEATERLAGWGRGDRDRPTIDYILRLSPDAQESA